MNMTGRYLRKCREDRSLSKYRVLQTVRVPESQLRRIEDGKQFPTSETIMRLARAYELSPAERHALLRCIDHDLLKPYRTPLNQMRGGSPSV